MNKRSKLHLAQQDVYYGQLMNPQSSLYNIGGYITLKGKLDTSQVKLIVEGSSEVFDIYNIKFDFTGEEPLYYSEGLQEPVLLDELDFSSTLQPKKEALDWMQNQFNTAFDLTDDKLYKLTLVKISEEEHYLFYCSHHLIIDGIAFVLFINYIIDQYKKFLNGDKEPVTVYPSYTDATQRSIDYLESKHYDKDAIYWKEKYDDIPNLILNQKKQQKEKGHLFSVSISELDIESLDRLSKQTKSNVSQLTIAALMLYFGKTTEQKDFSFGLPIHNRRGRDERKTLGMFSGVLPFKGEFKASQLLSDVISDIRQTQRDDFRHGLYPISHLNRSLNLLSKNRLQIFDIVINYELLPFKDSVSSDLSVQVKELKSTLDLEVPLSIRWFDYGQDSPLELHIDYQGEYFDEKEIETLVTRLLFILRQFEAGLDEPIKDISILPEKEEHQLLNVFNDTVVIYPKDDGTIVKLFEEQVKKSPEAIAVSYQGNELSYKELDERSNQLAHYLVGKGVKVEDLIGVCLERSSEMIISILGILKAGGVYVPIDPTYPENRINYIIKDASIGILLTNTSIVDRVSNSGIKELILLDSISELIEKETKKPLEVGLSVTNLAYIIYTSGSTGLPKGVMIEHGGICNTVQGQISLFSLSSKDNCLQYASPSFDASIWEILLSLLSGATLCIIDESKKYEVEYFIEFVKEQEITFSTLPPAFLKLIDVLKISNIKTLVTAGEEAPLKNAKLFSKTGNYFNAYGPTETSICATIFNGEIDDSIPIGSPIANTSIYILNTDLELVPTGTIGELCVGGNGLARGYLNQEELTKEKFITNPLDKGGRIYKTGDLARWLPDGNIEFIGRKDDQVKIRGYRIELGEIENTLSLVSGVTQCCVLGKKDSNGNKRLIAYVVLEGDLNKEALQETLKLSLPEYMVPQLWVELDEIPLTSNGKIDKQSLPDPDSSALSTKEYVGPRTEIEIQLVDIWQHILSVQKVGVYDNFFELGGHSLLATRLVSAIRKEFNIEITIRDVFSYTHIASLAAYLSIQDKGTLLPKVTVVDQKPDKIPLSFSQESLWFMDQLKGTLEYHQPFAFRLSGDLDKKALYSSFKEVVNRHEVLRTIIYSEEGVGYQKLLSADNWELPFKDVTTDNSLLTEDLNTFLSKPFNLSTDYMFRLCLYGLGDQEYVLAGVFHHISSDAWSQDILVNEFMQLYSFYKSGKAVSLPILSLQYVDYALWQRTYLEGAVIDNQLRYWENKLEGVSELQLPTDYVRPTDQSVAGSSISFQLDNTLSTGIKSLSQKEGATVFMTLLSVFKVLLSKYSGQQDICVGTSVANRTQKELEGMIGFFVNTLALRTQVTGSSTFQELLQDVKQTTLDAYDHQQVPLEKVVDRVVKIRDTNKNPLFQVLFVLQNTATSREIELDDVKLSNYGDQISTSNFDLKMTVSETDLGFTVNINYCTDLFQEGTVQRMFTHYQELLTGIVESPSTQLCNLSMLTDDESNQLLNLLNETRISLSNEETTVIDLFTKQVKKTPNAVAIVYEGKELSYQELDERSNQLASYLINKGIKSNDLVGLCIDRSLEMLIGVFGILKSGGAYVPIDPEYPQSRIDYMLSDSGVAILLADKFTVSKMSSKVNLATVLLDNDWDLIAKESIESIDKVSSPNDLAYVIYTSGSTGQPKGVLIAHKSLTDYFYGIIDKTNILDCNSFGLSSSIATDLGNTILYTSLLIGGALYILTEDELISSEKMSVLDIDCLKMVPSHWKTLQSKNNIFVPNKCLILGGEQFTDDVLEMMVSNKVSCEVYNHYGPTETTIGKLINKISLTEKPEHSVSLGVPFGNTTIYVLDSDNNLCPIGVTGELCIGGDGLAVGYLNQEELTSEKFIENPFKEGERIYKTGDLARWLPNGKIEFIGRKDHQIKIRGYRIELGEIENVLSKVLGIAHSCVLANEDENGDKRLIGYVVLEGELDKEVLQESLKESLPEYMVPMIWIKLDEMPLTNNGKIDRKSLPEPDNEGLSSKAYVAPRTESEEQLVAIWKDLLKVEKVGIYDNFFELGGQSLLAIRLIARLKKIGYSVNIRDFYSDPSIALLSTKLTSASLDYKVPVNGITVDCDYITPSMISLAKLSQEELETIMDEVPGGGKNIQDIYPLSPLQEGIYFHHLMSDKEHGDPYVISNLLSFESAKKRSGFIEGLRFIISRHDVFRTGILNTGLSEALQIVLREVDLPVKELIIDENQEILPQVEQELSPDNLYMDLSDAPMLQVKIADDEAKDAYYLVLNHHHLMIDHVGMAKVREEIMYFLSGKQGLLSTPSLYRDFIGNTLNKEVLEKSEKYFSSLFREIEESTYPFNLSDTQVDGTVAIESASKKLSSDLRDAIRRVSNNLKISPAVLFHGAFGLVVARCSDTDYALFGSLFLGRLQGAKGSESSLGLFMNTLPVLLDLKGSASTYVSHTDKRLQELLSYEQTPLSKIHQWSGISNDTPLFSALLNYRHSVENALSTENDLGGELLSGEQRTNYPFSLEVDDYGTDFGLRSIISDKNIDPSSIISYMEEALTVLLGDIDKESITGVNELSVLSKEEKHQLLNTFNDTEVSYQKDKTIVDLFEEQVEKIPNAVAVVFEGEQLSYQELDNRSNQLARHLITKGIKTDGLIGICVDRSLEMLVGVLGILKSGGAYVPMDPEYPKDRIDYMLNDSAVNIVLTESKYQNTFSENDNLTIISLDEDWADISKTSDKALERVSSPANLAYVIYTSGSTGQPKGVLNSHKGILNRLLWTQETYGLERSVDVVLQKTTFCFDVSVWELLWPLISGCKLVFARPGGQGDARYLKELIEKEEVTTVHFVPSMLGVFLEDISKGDCKSLERVLCSGEALSIEQARLFRNKFPKIRFDNLYGPTEAAIDVSSWSVPEDVTSLLSIPIGSPVSNTSLYILDTHENLVPLGVVGELCIGGDQVSVGYLNKEELTNESFVSNPFIKGDRMYKTGDLAYWLPDGTIEFVGRKDSQVKIRGYRIELGEIENRLSLVSGVHQSCVLVKKDGIGSSTLIAYVVLDGGVEKATIEKELKEGLPVYMVPQLWVELDEMPLTSNGKLDRKVLRALDNSELSSKEYVGSRTETEAQLVDIWQDLLGLEKVGVYDNFFELGGHSLLVVRLISKIQDIGYTISIQDIFSYPSIALLSTKLSLAPSSYKVPANGIKEGCDYITPSMVPLVSLDQEELEFIMAKVPGGGINIQDIYPLSPLQEGIYFHHLMSDEKEGDPYVLPHLLSFSSQEKRLEFVEGLRFVIGRHDVLRTCILNTGLSEVLQVVLREVDLEVEELLIDDSQDILAQVEKEIAPANLWIDPSQASMLQIKIADDVSNNSYYLVLNFHHLMMDHIGLEKVQQEVFLYLSGKADSLLNPSLYREFIGDTLNKDKLKKSENYFKKLFREVEDPTYPFNLSNTLGDGSTVIESSKVILSPVLSNKIRKVSTNLHISPAVLFHAAYGLVIGRCSDRDYALFGSLFLGRLQGSKGSETSLGLFINTLPLLLDLKGNISDYINQTSKHLQELLSYEQTPLPSIHNWSGISNDVPMFSGLLNYRHSKPSLSSGEIVDLGAELLSGEERTNYPFNVDVDDYGVDFRLTAKLSGINIAPSSVISYMEEALTVLVEGIDKESPSEQVDSLSILPKEEEDQLLNIFNKREVTYPTEKSTIDLFEEQVKKTPNAIAVVYGGAELSYSELDERSNQLSHYLIKKGVKANTLVGICVDRSLEMLVGIFGVLKSGGAYVPIDPEYPQDRIEYVLEDSGAKVVLITSKNQNNFTDKDDLALILLDTDWDTIAKEPTKKSDKVTSPANLAYVIYTSGSTGKPKGVPIKQASLLNFLLGMVDRLDMKEMETFLSVTTYTFDIFYLELFTPLLLGSKVVVLDNASIRDGDKLQLAIASYRPDFMQATPSIWQMLVDNGWGNKEDITVLTGGEAITESLKDSLTNISSTVWNLYGPTEATIWVTAQRLRYLEKVTIGSAINNVQLYVLDNSNKIVPIGAVGELCIGGIQLSEGYLNRSDLTAEKFIANPFKEGERIYRTGDLARWLSDGSIDLIGRKDNQVKIRGYRIELGEIENTLSLVSGVSQSCVLAKEDDKGNKRLIGYVVLEEGELDKEFLQEQLKESLPEYMVPQLWVEMDEMPLTSNGKLNRKGLPDIDSSELSSKAYVAPRTETEEQLVRIWQDLLGVEKVGIYDNFFELGGHSLLATRLVSTIRKELDIEIAIRDIFELNCVEQLGNYIQSLSLKSDEVDDEILFEQTI